jgi:hypothetical protein
VSWRKGALALGLLLADLAASSCLGARRWAGDEADRIDAVMAGQQAVDAGSSGAEVVPVAMGDAPPLAPPTSRLRQLRLTTPWSAPPVRVRGGRWSPGRARVQVIGRDTVMVERAGLTR